MTRRAEAVPTLEVCILAGGLSTRMGRDKARLRLNGRSMLSLVRANAIRLGHRVQVIRRDAVPRCGPLGGIVTVLRRTQANAVLFLACDMPLVSVEFLQRMTRAFGRKPQRAIVASGANGVGFPCIIPHHALATVEGQLAARELSLQRLATALRAARVRGRQRDLFNVNTPDDAERAAEWLRRLPLQHRQRNRLQSSRAKAFSPALSRGVA
jgi:molybdenum cofactor guanylyltransferase